MAKIAIQIRIRNVNTYRLSKHLWYASNPNKPSNKEEALATYYHEFHPGTSPSLSFKLLHTKQNMIMQKIFEAYIISNLKPNINNKDECIDMYCYLLLFIYLSMPNIFNFA